MTAINAFSVNVRGLRQKKKRVSVFDWLKRSHSGDKSFVFIQETHSTVDIETEWNSDWGCNMFYSHGSSTSCGVLIIPPRCHDYTIDCLYKDCDGRILILKVEDDNECFVLVNVYDPSGNDNEKIEFCTTLSNSLDNVMSMIESFNCIAGGDFNVCLQPELDSYSKSQSHDKYRNSVISLMENLNLIDAWRISNPDLRHFTWRRKNPLQQSRLDYWMISSHMLYNMTDIDIAPAFKSDHSPIKIKFECKNKDVRGPGFWKFNASLLDDGDYCEYIKGMIEKLKEEYNNVPDLSLKWDLIKMEIRSASIAYSKTQARLKRQFEKDLTEEMKNLEEAMNSSPTQSILDKYSYLQSQLETFYDHRAKGAILRSKINKVEYGEKNSKFFLNLEKNNYETKHIKKLITESDVTITSQPAILKYEEQFYQNLLSSKFDPLDNERISVTEEFLQKLTLPSLTGNSHYLCEKSLDMDECKKAIDNLANGKSPGTDGFTADFYKYFWKDIKFLLFESFTYSFETGKLSIDQRRGVLSLNPKKDKDIRYLKNWRPITLLNTDYKIIAKALGTRLRTVLPELIHSDQVAYLEDRYIGQNIRIIDDVLCYAENTNSDGIIACIDFEKAFDSVEWSYINKVLLSFKFGPNFIRWSKIMYNEISSCVMNNGYSSKFFNVTRGIRQGCPLSAYLFLLVAETLAAGIRQDTHISGMKMGDNEHSVIQMADDTTLLLKDPISLQRCLVLFVIYGQISGLRINITKSEAMGLGKYKILFIVKPYGLMWKENTLLSLGITFHRDPNKTIETNFNQKFTKVRNLLNMWTQRKLSIKGKITVIKSVVLPQILYISSNLGVPEWFVSKMNSLLYHFIWGAKMDKVKRATLINRIEKGGLKMIDLETMIQSQRIMWVKRFFKQTERAGWTFHFEFLCNKLKISPTDLFKCNLDPEFLCTTWPLFYHQMLFAWFHFKSVDCKITPWNIRRECLIYNKNITIGDRYARGRYLPWFQAGLRQIHDLYDYKGNAYPVSFLEEKYSIQIDILSYNSLISAIPNDFKMAIRNIPVASNAINHSELPHINVNKKEIPLTLISNQCVYWRLIKDITQPPISQISWNSLFVENINWPCIFKIPYDVTYDTKIQSFQYKILLRIFPCNWYVSKFDQNVDRICIFCQEATDDICHYFFDCQFCRHFWEYLQNWLRLKLAINDTSSLINRKNVVLGLVSESNDRLIINFILLHAKWFIIIKKLGKANSLHAIEFFNMLRIKVDVNLTIARHQSNQSMIPKMSALLSLLD